LSQKLSFPLSGSACKALFGAALAKRLQMAFVFKKNCLSLHPRLVKTIV
jgi:hypothetical protein